LRTVSKKANRPADAVAVWREDEDGEPVYEIVRRDIREVMVAATLARKARQG
jgi:hypothetical protein